MKKRSLIIVGTSTTAEHVLEFVRHHDLFDVVGFAVSEQYRTVDEFQGLPVYSLERLREDCPVSELCVFVAMMWNRLNADRRKVFNYCREQGLEMVNLISPLAVVRGRLEGSNIWVHDFVVIQNDASIGSDTFIMAYGLVGASARVGKHCFLAARSLVAGGSSIGEQSFVGLSATVFDDTQVGQKCIVGACTAVKRNLPDFSKCITSADNVVVKQYAEEEVESKLQFRLNKR